jgi:hypothetical protein
MASGTHGDAGGHAHAAAFCASGAMAVRSRTRRVSPSTWSRTTAFRRTVMGLMDKRLVYADNGLVWLPVQPEPPDFDDLEAEGEL